MGNSFSFLYEEVRKVFFFKKTLKLHDSKTICGVHQHHNLVLVFPILTLKQHQESPNPSKKEQVSFLRHAKSTDQSHYMLFPN